MFDEFHRVCKSGASVFLNDNLPYNPFILIYRLLRFCKGFIDPKTKAYIATIKEYLTYEKIPQNLFTINEYRRLFFLSALCFSGTKEPGISGFLLKVDDFLLCRIKFLQNFCWFATYRLIR